MDSGVVPLHFEVNLSCYCAWLAATISHFILQPLCSQEALTWQTMARSTPQTSTSIFGVICVWSFLLRPLACISICNGPLHCTLHRLLASFVVPVRQGLETRENAMMKKNTSNIRPIPITKQRLERLIKVSGRCSSWAEPALKKLQCPLRKWTHDLSKWTCTSILDHPMVSSV